ncbi:glycosyltransferase family 4 protein [Sinorhizobium americanum]|uniref:Glycosyltransferase involved in cell wall biosynthesis n=1 Tax=Sinorhizobium americanum TaxID=194963 RepID=A0A4R2C1I0_9HYPH|nr:glycosyltransferase family 4 protein [Sinorhizobium americanum]TCN33282.1 glycosyltransferase involved in cell wall biosynthesis [Sinorhizobium americanum]
MSSQTAAAVSRDLAPAQTRGSATSVNPARSGEGFAEKLRSVDTQAVATAVLLEGPSSGLGTALSPDEFEAFHPSIEKAAARPRVMMLGLRGIPDVQGGVEKHVEMLSARLAALGWGVDVIGRQRYLAKASSYSWSEIRVFPLWAPRSMALEAIVHTFVGVCFAALRRPDVLHIHAIGPALLVPLARLLGLKVVVTHHGYDYDRQKWSTFAKRMLKLGERMGMRLAHGRIGISKEIVETMGQRYGVPVAFVPNGVAISPWRGETGILDEFGLTRRRYILLAARLVPEKRQTDLIRAFAGLGDTDVKLVLAGSAEFETPYAAEVKALAEGVPGVVLTGFQSGHRLAELFANAALFVLPSSHEGMPIALLEAMAHGLPVLASDIVANRELALATDDYFPLGDIDALAAAIARKIANPPSDDAVSAQIAHVESAHSWASVAQKTLAVYRALAR